MPMIPLCFVVVCLLAPAHSEPSVASPKPRSTDVFEIDPLMLVQAEAVWNVIAQPDNAVWPGWDASTTPILFYLPGIQDVLINHPAPPKDFRPYDGPLSFLGGEITLRDGPTLLEWDGQNTAIDVNGVRTLVVADTLSNLRSQLSGFVNAPGGMTRELDFKADLLTSTYGQMFTIAHEAFHVHQHHVSPGLGPNEASVAKYPCLSVKNNVGFALEAKAMMEAIKTRDDDNARDSALRWLAVRLDRRRDMSDVAIAYEDGNELSEGLAKYIEYAIIDVLEGTEPPEALWLAQGFQGFEDLSRARERLLDIIPISMRGDLSVNNDPYGTAPIRMRLYHSGMALGVMLDRLDPTWKTRVFAEGLTLTQLMTLVLDPTDDDLADALEDALDDLEYADLVASKTRLAEEGARDTQRMLDSVTSSEHGSVVIDYTDLQDPEVAMSFTAFGVRAVDADRTIYTMVPISASFRGDRYLFKQQTPLPTLQDVSEQRFEFPLRESLSRASLERHLGSGSGDEWFVDDLDIMLDTTQVVAPRAAVRWVDGSVVVRLLAD